MEDLDALCLSFSDGFLFNEVDGLEDSFDFEGMMAAGQRLYDKLLLINDACREILDGASRQALEAPRIVVHDKDTTALTWLDLCRPYLIFGSDSCDMCATCTYPDEPCIHQDRFFIPIEACGINVTVLSKQLDMNYSAGPNTVTFFGMLLF